jgi:predicted lactoylglutathione lyase
MGLELYMVGVIVEDMTRAVQFYRRLGLDIAEGSENKQHVEVKMSGLTFFLNAKSFNLRWDPAKIEPSGGYRIILEFYMKSREAVEAKYAEMIGYGYEAHGVPHEVGGGMYFALINDPDDNTILLSGAMGEAS